MIDALINQACSVILREEDDETEYGVPSRETSTLTTVCYLEQSRSTEEAAAGEASESDYLAVFKADEEDLTPASQLVVGGRVYEFVSEPWTVYDPELQANSHIEATVRYTGTQEGS